MISQALKDALAYLFENEGRTYVNDPHDAGGPTKFGVTLMSYAAYLGREVLPAEIEALTIDQVAPFYDDRYWKPLRCDRILTPGIRIALFDCGVLYGVGTAGLLAQEALVKCGATCASPCWCGSPLKIDGKVGDKTLNAFNSAEEGLFLIAFEACILARIDEVIALRPTNERYRNGWTKRAKRLLTLAKVGPLNREVT